MNILSPHQKEILDAFFIELLKNTSKGVSLEIDSCGIWINGRLLDLPISYIERDKKRYEDRYKKAMEEAKGEGNFSKEFIAFVEKVIKKRTKRSSVWILLGETLNFTFFNDNLDNFSLRYTGGEYQEQAILDIFKENRDIKKIEEGLMVSIPSWFESFYKNEIKKIQNK